MALSNRYIAEAIPVGLWDRYSQVETDIILAFAARARDMDYTTLWLADKIKAMRILREDIEHIVSKSWPGTKRELSNTMDQAGFKSLTEDERIFRRAVDAGLLPAAPAIAGSIPLKRLLEAGFNRAANKLSIVNATAINTTLAALDEAYMQVSMGAFTLDVAVEQAVTKLASEGVTGAAFASGRTMQLAPYVRMVVRTEVMQTTSELGFARMEEYGSDLLQVSAHAGARPRCAPFQGRVFSRNGTHKHFAPWSSTSFGEPAGLLGINCGHFVTPFIEGLDRIPTKEERDPARYELGRPNSEVYDESQEQRYNERMIREWKHREKALKAADIDSTRAREKVREWQARQREFIERTERTRRYGRERIIA